MSHLLTLIVDHPKKRFIFPLCVSMYFCTECFYFNIDMLYHNFFQLTFCNVVTIDEKLVYSPHPADSSK